MGSLSKAVVESLLEEDFDRRCRGIRLDALRALAAAGDAGSACALLDEIDDIEAEAEIDALGNRVYRALSPELRAFIFARDGRICGICSGVAGPFEIDHKHPYSRGGSHDAENLWVLCKGCNRDKGALTVPEYFKAREHANPEALR